MAIYLEGPRVLIVEVPKTGTSWLRKVFSCVPHRIEEPSQGISERHGRPQDFDVERIETVCTVRHPIRWAISWYFFQNQNGWPSYEPEVWHPQREIEDCKAGDISTFADILSRKHPGYISRMFEGYADGCDRVMRQEMLREDAAKLARDHGVEVDVMIPRENVTKKSKELIAWEPLKRLMKSEERAVDRWYDGVSVHGILK